MRPGCALQAAVDEVDAQMSTWKPGQRPDAPQCSATSAMDRRSGAPDDRAEASALEIGRASGGAFDIGVGDAVAAWGFGPAAAATERIRAAMARAAPPAHEVLELDAGRVRKRAPITLDLNGIAKGYGVDRLAETLASLRHRVRTRRHRRRDAGHGAAGRMAKHGRSRSRGQTRRRRAPHSIIALHDAAVATSGDYRHWVDVGSQRLSHTMDPARGAPLKASPASVTVVARTCAEADAWATALMV